MSKKKTIITSVIILLVAAVATYFIFISAPEAKREGATKEMAMLVDIEVVEKGDFTPIVVATGVVQAAKDIILSPQVSGEVTSISDNFIPGSYVKKGEKLVQINPADYINTLQLRKSDLQLAEADLRIEMGRQEVAQKDYELVGQEMSAKNKDLVLREPQLEAARANVAAAKAAVNQAELNLQRATIKAPFDAHIISRNTNVGSQVAIGQEIGRIVGIDEYWIIANVPTSKINWLSFAEGPSEVASEVKIYNNSWPAGEYRQGKLFRLVGALDAETRLARVLISVKDPLARKPQNDTVPPLMIGTFVETHVEAEEIQNVVRLNRDHLRQNNTVWVMEDGQLQIEKVDIIFQDARYAYIKKGLEDNDKIVTTDLSTVVEGSPLRTEENIEMDGSDAGE